MFAHPCPTAFKKSRKSRAQNKRCLPTLHPPLLARFRSPETTSITSHVSCLGRIPRRQVFAIRRYGLDQSPSDHIRFGQVNRERPAVSQKSDIVHSRLFRPKLHTDLEPGNVALAGLATSSVAALRLVRSAARYTDWLWLRTTAHFGERCCFPLERFVMPRTRPGLWQDIAILTRTGGGR